MSLEPVQVEEQNSHYYKSLVDDLLEKKVTEQEKKIADQGKKIVDQEEKLSETSWALTGIKLAVAVSIPRYNTNQSW